MYPNTRILQKIKSVKSLTLNWSSKLQENNERKKTTNLVHIDRYQVSFYAEHYFGQLPIVPDAFKN